MERQVAPIGLNRARTQARGKQELQKQCQLGPDVERLGLESK